MVMQQVMRGIRWTMVVLLGLGWLVWVREPAYGQEKWPEPEAPSAEVAAAEPLLRQIMQLFAEGQYDQALPLAERALAIYEQTLGPQAPRVAILLNFLAMLYRAKGDYGQAAPLLERVLAMSEHTFGPEHPEVATALNNLGSLYRAMGNYRQAEPLFKRALAIREQALGPEHPDVAISLNNLAELHWEDDYTGAEALAQRALAIRTQALGSEHPDVAISLNNLAWAYLAQGNHHQAEALFQQALAIWEQALGPQHPHVATALASLAALYRAQDDVARAVAFMRRSADIREHHLTLILATGAEAQKRAYLATLTHETYATVSLHVQAAPGDLPSRRAALTTVLQRKGRVLEAMADSRQALRRRLEPEDQSRFERLAALRTQLATLVLGGPGTRAPEPQRQQVVQLEAQAEQLEAELSARSAAFRSQVPSVTLAQVHAAIPEGMALVEFVWYKSYQPQTTRRAERWGAPRYVAYVLHPQGEPAWVDLGEAAPLDRAVAALRRALSHPSRSEVRQHARALDERLMRPIRPLLGESRHVLLAPDGALTLLPFEALVDEDDGYLVERFTFTYLTTGRDLLRLQVSSPSRQGPVVVANPAFDGPPGAPALPEVGPETSLSAHRAAEMAELWFAPLLGTAEEAAALMPLLPGATLLTQEAATEAALKQLRSPRLLHVATHGFFLPDQPEAPTPSPWRENPLIRSGLALAGANRRPSEGEDGILTALEAAGLALEGTQLVVLSACETGVGEVQTGEGVYGLRRALVIAGAESQVMSLWPVADAATRDLMVAYYGRLVRGEGRSAALRQVQLAFLARPDRRHPFYWASFILSGVWAPLDGVAAERSSSGCQLHALRRRLATGTARGMAPRTGPFIGERCSRDPTRAVHLSEEAPPPEYLLARMGVALYTNAARCPRVKHRCDRRTSKWSYSVPSSASDSGSDDGK